LIPRDLRKYSRQTTIRSGIGFLFLLVFVGGGLIYIFYGLEAVIGGLICMGLGLLPLGLIALALVLIGWVSGKVN
jgi:hypothetical protein